MRTTLPVLETYSFPRGFRELGESLTEACQREMLEETGHAVNGLSLYDIYTDDAKRLVWVIFEGVLGAGNFEENVETSELTLLAKEELPSGAALRGHLTRRLVSSLP